MISLIAAMAANRAIGMGNALPWQLPEDLKRFKETTLGHPIVMGRKTFESIGRPLPKRRNIIVTRQDDYAPAGVEVARSLEEALRLAAMGVTSEVFVIGGADIYRQALPLADRLRLTLINHDVAGDAFFPEWNASEFREVSREERAEPFPFSFVVLERDKGTS